MPFRTLCLQQAIAARTMLARRGIDSVLHLGVRDPTTPRWRRMPGSMSAGSTSPAIRSIRR
ncbi:lasso peptide biosynthesis B2 protein [Sphingomonas aurantiaca]|uniref:lasso peptide biosynthesis B2 protein n=1 Tax=Sphingomonas aurantiaca TaxID=185949 RepID=UPI003A5C123C